MFLSLMDTLDDSYLIVNHTQAEQVEKFRVDLRQCETDTQRFHLCIEARNHLLEKHTKVGLLISAFEQVMFSECVKYKQTKERPRRTDETDTEQWERFIGVAASRST